MSKLKRMWIERKRTRVVYSSMPVDSAAFNAYVSGPISSKASKIPSRKTPPFCWGHHELRCPNPTHPGRTREVACRVNFVRSPLLYIKPSPIWLGPTSAGRVGAPQRHLERLQLTGKSQDVGYNIFHRREPLLRQDIRTPLSCKKGRR